MHPTSIELYVDRDSVAMGDDVRSHTAKLTVPRDILLSSALQTALPEIRAEGWSWVVVADGEVSAVWSVDHGIRLLVSDREVTDGPVDVYFRYFVQIDPA